MVQYLLPAVRVNCVVLFKTFSRVYNTCMIDIKNIHDVIQKNTVMQLVL